MNGYGSPFYHSHYCLKPNTEQIELPLTYNPVGSYRKIINIDKSWDDNQIILHFGAVKSAFYLYAAPKVRIADFHAQTTLTDNYRTGVLNFTALIGNRTTDFAKGYSLAIELLDHKNVKIASTSININNIEKTMIVKLQLKF